MEQEEVERLQEKLFDLKVLNRFVKNLEEKENGCIEYTGYIDSDGYGKISIGPRDDRVKIGTHRWALQFALGGVILKPHIFACHHCDNPKCVCPTHLYPGTHQENMADMVAKGRSAVVKNNCKLTVDELKDVKYGKEPYSYYVNKYDIAKSTVSDIRNGITWPEI